MLFLLFPSHDQKKEEKEAEAKSQEAKADTMVPTYPGHPGPGNKADSKTTRKAGELRDAWDKGS